MATALDAIQRPAASVPLAWLFAGVGFIVPAKYAGKPLLAATGSGGGHRNGALSERESGQQVINFNLCQSGIPPNCPPFSAGFGIARIADKPLHKGQDPRARRCDFGLHDAYE